MEEVESVVALDDISNSTDRGESKELGPEKGQESPTLKYGFDIIVPTDSVSKIELIGRQECKSFNQVEEACKEQEARIQQLLADAAAKDEENQKLKKCLLVAEVKISLLSNKNARLRNAVKILKSERVKDKKEIQQLKNERSSMNVELKVATLAEKKLAICESGHSMYTCEAYKTLRYVQTVQTELQKEVTSLKAQNTDLKGEVKLLQLSNQRKNEKYEDLRTRANTKIDEILTRLEKTQEQVTYMNCAYKDMVKAIHHELTTIDEHPLPRGCWPFSRQGSAREKLIGKRIAKVIEYTEYGISVDLIRIYGKLDWDDMETQTY